MQTQQLIAGGRHPELRGRETLAMLATLAEGGWIDAEARADLEAAYYFLRSVEHRLQMVADEQTHTLPAEREALERFARFAGYKDRDAFAETLLGHLRKVQQHYARLFEQRAGASPSERALAFPEKADSRETLDRLGEMGFKKPLEAAATVRRWFSGSYPSLQGRDRARASFAEIVPLLIDQLARSENPDAALMAFDRFLSALHAGARLFVLLSQHPDLDLAGSADARHRAAARRHSRAHPQVIDALLEPSFFGALPDEAKLAAALKRSLGRGRLLRGSARPRCACSARSNVPDRRAHPVRHGVGGAGGRGVRAACRRADPRAARSGRGAYSPSSTAACAGSRPRCSRSASSAAGR